MQECPENRSKLEKFKILEHHQNCVVSFKRHVRISHRSEMFMQKELISEETLRSIFFCILKKFIFALIHEEVTVKCKRYQMFLNKCKRIKRVVRAVLQTA